MRAIDWKKGCGGELSFDCVSSKGSKLEGMPVCEWPHGAVLSHVLYRREINFVCIFVVVVISALSLLSLANTAYCPT